MECWSSMIQCMHLTYGVQADRVLSKTARGRSSDRGTVINKGKEKDRDEVRISEDRERVDIVKRQTLVLLLTLTQTFSFNRRLTVILGASPAMILQPESTALNFYGRWC